MRQRRQIKSNCKCKRCHGIVYCRLNCRYGTSPWSSINNLIIEAVKFSGQNAIRVENIIFAIVITMSILCGVAALMFLPYLRAIQKAQTAPIEALIQIPALVSLQLQLNMERRIKMIKAEMNEDEEGSDDSDDEGMAEGAALMRSGQGQGRRGSTQDDASVPSHGVPDYLDMTDWAAVYARINVEESRRQKRIAKREAARAAGKGASDNSGGNSTRAFLFAFGRPRAQQQRRKPGTVASSATSLKSRGSFLMLMPYLMPPLVIFFFYIGLYLMSAGTLHDIKNLSRVSSLSDQRVAALRSVGSSLVG